MLQRGEKEKVRKYLIPLSSLSSPYPIDCLVVELLSLDFELGTGFLVGKCSTVGNRGTEIREREWDPGLVKFSDLV